MSDNGKRHDVIIGGTGGQGVITIGYVLAQAASNFYKYITRFPIYMATMRGGPALCTVIFSDEEIAAPILSNYHHAITMENATFGRFKKGITDGGQIVLNSSIIKLKEGEELNFTPYPVPVTDMAQEMNAPFLANMIMLGAYRQVMGILSDEAIKDAMEYILKSEGKESRLEKNLQAYAKGAEYAKSQGWGS